MAYEYLKKLFGETKEGEQPKSMTFEELEKAINEDSSIEVINLKGSDYVPKEKLDKKITALNDTKALLDAANQEITKYKDMDIEGIQKSVGDWQAKYDADTKALQDKLDAQEREFATDKFLGNYKFSSDMARKAVLGEFLAKNLALENGKFLGAEDFMKQMQETDPGAFVVEEPAGSEPPAPSFAGTTPATPPKSGKKMTLLEKMKFANEHPGTDVSTLFE